MDADSTAQTWLRRFAKLRVDTDSEKGRAPHKPLLLLAVVELLEEGQFADGWVGLTPDLVVRFQNLWPLVAERRKNRGDIRMPFHALGTDRVWEVFDSDGRPSRAKPTSTRARLDPALLALLGDAAFREELRRVLIRSYFPADEQVGLAEALGLEATPAGAERFLVEEEAERFVVARRLGRSARFKTAVVSGYRFTCALTGYRLTTVDQLGIVEAAHIHAHASSRNDRPENGLALTPTAHALFDLGLWSVADDLRVLVKPEGTFREESPQGGFSLRALSGQPLRLPPGARLRPAAEHLAWHRRHHGFARG